MSIRLGVVDSGCAPVCGEQLRAGASFVLTDAGVVEQPLQADALGHGTLVTGIIAQLAPAAELLVAQVFQQRVSTTALQVAAAIDWLLAHQVQLINLSLGLSAPRPALAAACERALAAGVVLCASVPSMPRTVYPAGFAGVLRVTGDARCAREQIAALAAAHADFGAHVRPLDGSLNGAGASLACAHFSALASRHLADGGDAASLRPWLHTVASYHGMEDLAALKRAARQQEKGR